MACERIQIFNLIAMFVVIIPVTLSEISERKLHFSFAVSTLRSVHHRNMAVYMRP